MPMRFSSATAWLWLKPWVARHASKSWITDSSGGFVGFFFVTLLDTPCGVRRQTETARARRVADGESI